MQAGETLEIDQPVDPDSAGLGSYSMFERLFYDDYSSNTPPLRERVRRGEISREEAFHVINKLRFALIIQVEKLNAIAGDPVILFRRFHCLRHYMPDFFGVYDNLKVTEYMDFYAGTYGIPYKERGGRSSPDAGSSSISRLGSCIRLRARQSLCFMPRESEST